jgi:hypothetical protein
MQSLNKFWGGLRLAPFLSFKKEKTMRDDEDNDQGLVSDDGIVDAGKFQIPKKQESDPLEKEEREKAKANAPQAAAGKFIVNCDMKSDGKRYKKGDTYEGKLYPEMLSDKSLITIEEWTKR